MSHRQARGGSVSDIETLRASIAAEAARVIVESGVHDYAFAKRKAAARLGLGAQAPMPANDEVDAALRTHQRLFQGDVQPAMLRHLREVAVEAMAFLADFEPRLVGAVLDGSADDQSAVCLHLFSDDPDAPARFLDDARIRYRSTTHRLRWQDDAGIECAALRFEADDATIDLTVFDSDARRHAPIDPVTGKPMQRATRAAVAALLAADAGGSSD